MNCGDCKWSKIEKYFDWIDIERTRIRCVRGPPQAVTSGGGGGEITEHGYGTGKYHGISVSTGFAFPIVKEDDYCGEFRTRVDLEP